MMRRLVTIHKAVKAKELAEIVKTVDELFGGDVRVDQTVDGITLKAYNGWQTRMDGR